MISKKVLILVNILMALSGLVAAYSLLTYGSPDSLLRLLFPDPAADWYLAVICSAAFFILGFVPYYARDQKGYRELVEMNAEKIRSLRKRKKTDEDIAESILAAMGSRKGYRHNMARQKLVYYLSRFR